MKVVWTFLVTVMIAAPVSAWWGVWRDWYWGERVNRDIDVDTTDDIQTRETVSLRNNGKRWWTGWRRWSGKREERDVDFDTDDALDEREVFRPKSEWWEMVRWPLGKREVLDSDFDPVYNAAAEDGIFTDEEITSVFRIDENGLAEFKENFDVNGDGVVQVEEYELVNTI